MDANGYVAFLAFGVLLILVDGQVIYRSGKDYLAEVYPEPGAANSMNQLITMLFHLFVLGLFALISTIGFGNQNTAQAVMARLGMVLLLIAVAHAATMIVLATIRRRQREAQIAEEVTEQVEVQRKIELAENALRRPVPEQPTAGQYDRTVAVTDPETRETRETPAR